MVFLSYISRTPSSFLQCSLSSAKIREYLEIQHFFLLFLTKFTYLLIFCLTSRRHFSPYQITALYILSSVTKLPRGGNFCTGFIFLNTLSASFVDTHAFYLLIIIDSPFLLLFYTTLFNSTFCLLHESPINTIHFAYDMLSRLCPSIINFGNSYN